MVDILKEGNTKTKKFTCPTCNTIFIADFWDYYFGQINCEWSYQISCPLCHKMHTYKSNEVQDYERQEKHF